MPFSNNIGIQQPAYKFRGCCYRLLPPVSKRWRFRHLKWARWKLKIHVWNINFRWLEGSNLYCIQRFLVPALGQEVKYISLNWANLMCNWLPACKSISDFKLLWKACGGLPPFYICLPLLLIYSLVNILKIKKILRWYLIWETSRTPMMVG